MDTRQLQSIGIGTVLVLINVVLIAGIGLTPLAPLARSMFNYLIVGVIVFGAILTLGRYLALNALLDREMPKAVAGVALLQFGYGWFGGGIIDLVPTAFYVEVLAVTAIVTAGLAIGAGMVVFFTDRDFGPFERYANYAFLGVLGFALLGTFVPVLAVIAFLLAFVGFLLLLVHALWEVENRPEYVLLNGLAVYVAVMGVFVHVLRLVVQLYRRR